MAKKPARKPSKAEAEFIRVRMAPAYKTWLRTFAERERSDISDLVDDALAHYALARGMEAPPKR